LSSRAWRRHSSNVRPTSRWNARSTVRALTFYRDTLGLKLVEETPFAFVFDAHGTTLRVTPVQKVAVVAGFKDPDGNTLSVTEF